MQKRLILLLVLVAGLTVNCGWSTAAAGKDSSGLVEVIVSAPKSPASLPILRMMATGALGPKVKLGLMFSSMDQLLAVATRNECPMLLMPINSAVTFTIKALTSNC
jgi:hypothetical protein